MKIIREEILSYLEGPRRYMEGVALYEKYGANKTLVQTFIRQGVTKASQAMLYEELRKIAGISERDFGKIRQRVSKPVAPANKIVAAKTTTETVTEEKTVTETPTTIKVVKFREKFPFLTEDDCPDVLKILVADLFTAYAKYKEAHAKLSELPDDADALEAARLSEEVVENFIQNREIWEELEYYQENHELLGKCDKVKAIQERQGVAELTDVELLQKRNSAAAQISKAKKVLENPKADEEKKAKAKDTLALWTAKKEAMEAEIDSRKKN